jgi:aldehyde dehydrogenase (NAD+)
MNAASNSYSDLFQKQKTFHLQVKHSSHDLRIQKLKRLRKAIVERELEIQKALHADLKKAPTETQLTEIFPTLTEIDHAIKNLKKWMKVVSAPTPWSLLGSRSHVHIEPKGVVLIIAPWNYPFQLTMIPLISAISAGNCIVLKPSEFAPQTSRWVHNLIAELFSENEIACIEGGPEVSQSLLELPFDHIFFTGSTRLGKEVMKSAAEHLSSVTLELGGKSPAILDKSADLPSATKRIIWGKFINAGQTCVAPDYVLLHQSQLADFLEYAKKWIQAFYGETEEARKSSPDFCRIIHRRHYERLKLLLQESITRGAQIHAGGQFDDRDLYISPTLLSGIEFSHPLMNEEIFGPILPVLVYSHLDEVYERLRSQGKPLALYIFSQDQKNTEQILAHTSSGGTAINNTLLHLLNPHLPFGGAGPSGQGRYHGKHGFKEFSHTRSILTQGQFNATELMYPPYFAGVQRWVKLAMKFLT